MFSLFFNFCVWGSGLFLYAIGTPTLSLLRTLVDTLHFRWEGILYSYKDLVEHWNGPSFGNGLITSSCFVNVYSPLALAMARQQLTMLHVAPVTQRTPSKFLLDTRWPPRTEIKRFCAYAQHSDIKAEADARQQQQQQLRSLSLPVSDILRNPTHATAAGPVWWCTHFPHDPHSIVRFLDAAKEIKDGHRADLAFQKGLKAMFPTRYKEMKREAERTPAYGVMSAGRTRFELTMLLMHRREWKELVNAPGVVLRTALGGDKSPQGGLEVFSAVCETMVWTMGVFIRYFQTFFPFVLIGHGHASAEDIVMTLLHLIFLAFGPDTHTMRVFCNSVRWWLSDFGTEAKVPKSVDLLPVFTAYRKRTWLPPVNQLSRLFPRCIFMYGWNHNWNVVLKFVLKEIYWFADWLTKLKQVVAFFKTESYRNAIRNYLHSQGLLVEGDILLEFRCSFAKWRWQTLHECVICVMKIEFLVRLWRPVKETLFRNQQDKTELAAVSEAMEDTRFFTRTSNVKLICGKIELIRRWIGGCACHEYLRCPLMFTMTSF